MFQHKKTTAGFAVYELATCYRDAGRFPEAIHYYTDALSLLSDARINLRGCIFYDRAIAHDLHGEFSEAETDFKNSLRLFQEFVVCEPNDAAQPNFRTLIEQIQEQLKIRTHHSEQTLCTGRVSQPKYQRGIGRRLDNCMNHRLS